METTVKANDMQVGGDHYKNGGEEHWDRVARLGLDYFQACITKYVERCWKKDGLKDLKKARHFIDKYIELNTDREPEIGPEWRTLNFRLHPHQVNPAVAAYGGERKPDGWVGYTFEGSDDRGEFFRCTSCRDRFHVPVHSNPNHYHECHGTSAIDPGSEATSAYTNQDREGHTA